jgi:transcriptional/translational regulatory protein YebC/TACO1
VIVVDAEKYPEDQIMDLVLEAGAEDMSTEDGVHEISTSPEAFDAVSKALENAGIEMMSAELSYVPNDPVKLGHDDAVKLLKLIDKFEDHDDVQEVYHNAEIDEADMDAE